MRKSLLFLAIGAGILCSCSKFDDSALKKDIASLQKRVSDLEEQCTQMRTNLTSIQTLLSSVDGRDYITGVSPIVQDGKTIGYEIQFKKAAAVKVYNGIDAPAISIKKDSDGNFYWTLDGEFIIVAGKKVRANGADGSDAITPQLKVENGVWKVSYDNGKTWNDVPTSGNLNIVDSIQENETSIDIVFADGQKLSIPREVQYINFNDIRRQFLPGDYIAGKWSFPESLDGKLFSQVFCDNEAIEVSTNCGNEWVTGQISLSITVPVRNAPDNFTVNFELYYKEDAQEGKLIQCETILFTKGTVEFKGCEDDVINGIKVCYIGQEGGLRTFNYDSYQEVSLSIPWEYNWITYYLGEETKSLMSSHSFTLNISANKNALPRYALLKSTRLEDTFLFVQEGTMKNIDFIDNKTKDICVTNFDTDKDGEISFTEASAARLERGVNPFKGTQIESFPEFKYFYNIQETSFEGCESLSQIVVSPYVCNKFSERQFAGCASLNKIDIPNTIKEFGRHSFERSGLLSLTLPSAWDREMIKIGDYAFAGCSQLMSANISYVEYGKYSFLNCVSLSDVPTGYSGPPMEEVCIPEGAFAGCISLKGFNFFFVSKIDFKAFYGSGIRHVTTKGEIGDYAFANSAVSEIYIGNAKEIGAHCFEGCQMLNTVRAFSSSAVPTLGKNAFGTTQIGTLLLPKDGKFNYRFEDAGWFGMFKTIDYFDEDEEIDVPFEPIVGPWN